jgi:hypothetical protein
MRIQTAALPPMAMKRALSSPAGLSRARASSHSGHFDKPYTTEPWPFLPKLVLLGDAATAVDLPTSYRTGRLPY